MARELRGVELMAAGKVDGRIIDGKELGFSIDDLNSVADSFKALGLRGRVPLKFGHNDEQPMTDGQPALGWVDRVWVEGSKLLADFVDLPTVVFDAISQKLYRYISVELLRDVQAGTRKIPWVLDAVALLGADQPAFGTLKDLQSLMMRRRSNFRAGSRLRFTRGHFTINSEDKGMDESEVQALIRKETDKFSKQLADMEKANTEALEKKDKEMQAQQVKFHREKFDLMWNQAITDGRIEPKVRERFEALTNFKDDARCLEVNLETAKEYLDDHAKAPAKNKQKMSSGGTTDEPLTGTNADKVTELTIRSIQAAKESSSDFNVRLRHQKLVLSRNPKLARAYFEDPNAVEEVEEKSA